MNIEDIKPDVKKDYLIYTKKSICDNCKGFCCKTAAGIYAPEDFTVEITTPFLIHLLMTKQFAIESIGEGSQSDYFLRPRHVDENPVNTDIYGGLCVNWDSKVGCLLSEKERPYQCRTLIPLVDGVTCSHKPSDKALKSDMVYRWFPYQKELMLARSYYNDVMKNISIVYEFDEFGRYRDIYDNLEEILSKIQKVISNI